MHIVEMLLKAGCNQLWFHDHALVLGQVKNVSVFDNPPCFQDVVDQIIFS